MCIRRASIRVLCISALLILGLLCFDASKTCAATFTWDSLGASPTSPLDGPGTWDASLFLWSNGASDGQWVNDGTATAAFGFAAGGGTAGTVQVATPINVAGIVFNPPQSGNYTIADNGGGNSITLSGTTPTITVNNTTATISEVLSGSAGLTLTGSGTLNLSGSNNYSGNNTITGGSTLVLNAGGTLGQTSNATIIGGATAGGATPSKLTVNTNATVGSLGVNTNSATANVITIASGQTLTVDGSGSTSAAANGGATTLSGLVLGYINGTGGQTTAATFTGGGNLSVTGGNAYLGLGNGGTSNAILNLDMTGLGSFTYLNTAAAANFLVASGTGGNTGNRILTNVSLAPVTTVTTTNISIAAGSNSNGSGGGSPTGPTNVINLGSTSTTFDFSGTMKIGTEKSSANIQFSGTTGTLTILNTDGVSRAGNITIGSRGASGSVNPGTIIDLTLNGVNSHSVNILANTLILGESTNSSTGSAALKFDTGTMDFNSVNMAHRTNGTAVGTLTVGSNASSTGVLNVNGGISLANTTAAASATGKLILNGGTANIFGGIFQNGANTANAVVDIEGGVLDLHGNSIGGSGTGAAVTVTANGGTLQNVSEINGGSSGITKGTAGTFTLSGMNNYSGTTIVNSGTILLASAQAAQNSTLASAVTNGFSFAPSIGTFTVGSLTGSANQALTDNASQPVTLNLNNFNASNTYSGQLSGTGGSLVLTNGQLTLGGNSTYSGNTTISGGTLIMNSTGSLLSTGQVTVNNSGTLSGNMGPTKSIGITTLGFNGGGTIIAGTGNSNSGVLNMNGLVVDGGTLQFNLGVTTTSSMINVVNGGLVTIADPNQSGNSVPNLVIPNSAVAIGTYVLVQSTTAINYVNGNNFNFTHPNDSFTYALDFSSPNDILLDVTGQVVHLTWTGGIGPGDGSTWDTSSNSNAQNWKNTDTNTDGVNYADPAFVSFGDIGSTTNININLNNNVSPSSITVSGNTTNYTIQGGSSINGALTSVTKNGSTTFALLTPNNYAGGTVINGGTMQVCGDSGLGDTSGSVTINAAELEILNTTSGSSRAFLLGSTASTIQIDSGVAYTIGGTVSDVDMSHVGTLNANGNGTLALTGTNTYSGGTVISGGGIVQINNANGLGATTGTATINDGTLEATTSISTSRNFLLGANSSTIQVDGAASTYTISGAVNDGAGSGTLNKTGAGILVLTANNGYTGGTVIGSNLVAGGLVSISSDTAGARNLGPTTAIVPGSQFNNNIVLTNGGGLATTTTMALMARVRSACRARA